MVDENAAHAVFDVTVQVQMLAIFPETGVTILPEAGMIKILAGSRNGFGFA